jgi:hypothetical protein
VREPLTAQRLGQLFAAIGSAARDDVAIYLTGGTTAVLYGWRATTQDVDLRLEPEDDRVIRRIADLRHELRANVEFAFAGDFIPLPEGWRDRSIFIVREGRATFYHLDPYSQALAKLERAHPHDLEDVDAMLEAGLVERRRLRSFLDEIEPRLYRFPAVDGASFRRRVESVTTG